MPTLLVTPVQLMRPGIGQNMSCTLGDCLTSRLEGCLQPRKLWFSMYVHVLITVHNSILLNCLTRNTGSLGMDNIIAHEELRVSGGQVKIHVHADIH